MKIIKILSLIISITFFTTLLWYYDYSKNSPNIESNSILKISEIQGKLFLRQSGNPNWNDAVLDEVLTAGDEIRSLDNAVSVLKFTDEFGRIETGPNTAFKIFEDSDYKKIMFSGGELFVGYHSSSTKNKVIVVFNNIEVEFNDSDVFFFQDEWGQRNISVTYGRASIKVNDNKMELSSGQVLTFTGTAQYMVSEPAIKMSTPLNFDRFSVLNMKSFTTRFAWNNTSSYLYYQLYLGKTIGAMSAFNNPQLLKTKELNVDLVPGIYYFRLYAFDKLKSKSYVASDLHKIFIQEQAAIQPLFPENDIELSVLEKGGEIKFQWDNPSQFEKLFLEVSRSPNFKELTFHDTIQGANFLYVKFEKPGDYYWRINGFPQRSSKLVLGNHRKLIIK